MPRKSIPSSPSTVPTASGRRRSGRCRRSSKPGCKRVCSWEGQGKGTQGFETVHSSGKWRFGVEGRKALPAMRCVECRCHRDARRSRCGHRRSQYRMALRVRHGSLLGAPIFYRLWEAPQHGHAPQFQCASFHVEATGTFARSRCGHRRSHYRKSMQRQQPPATHRLTLSAPGTFPASRPRRSQPWVF